MADNLYKQTILPTLSLFTSISTLICCALPALLVTLGLGAVLAGIVANAPWLVVISQYKGVVFLVAGALLVLATGLQWNARNAPCPVDPIKARACSRLRKFSWTVLIFSIIIYMIGFFFAFVAERIFYG